MGAFMGGKYHDGAECCANTTNICLTNGRMLQLQVSMGAFN